MAERVLVGAGVGSGVAFGPAFLLIKHAGNDAGQAGRRNFGDVKMAMVAVAGELELGQSTGPTADVMFAISAMLRDPILLDEIKAHMAEGAGVDRGVRGAFSSFARQLNKLGGYFGERSADLLALADRVVDRVYGRTEPPAFPDYPYVLVTDSLNPMDAARLDPKRVIAVITAEGTPTSHSAIITRAASLPTVVGVVGAGEIANGSDLLVDAFSGQVFVKPTTEERRRYTDAALRATQLIKVIQEDIDLPVTLLANLGSSFEGKNALDAGAEGVGLFRTELLYLGREQPPGLEEQIYEYARLFARFKNKRVVARVLDLDLDKPLPFLKPAGSGRYKNRGLQVLLANEEVLVTQLKALAQAATYYPNVDLWVMAPMVLSAVEAARFAALARAAGHTKVGVMLEVPELAEPKEFAKVLEVVDFISIGTNDLTQYTLGASRHSGSLDLADVRNPKVMAVIESAISQARAAGKAVGICGESASDPESAAHYLRLGVDSLSASPALIPRLKAGLRASLEA